MWISFNLATLLAFLGSFNLMPQSADSYDMLNTYTGGSKVEAQLARPMENLMQPKTSIQMAGMPMPNITEGMSYMLKDPEMPMVPERIEDNRDLFVNYFPSIRNAPDIKIYDKLYHIKDALISQNLELSDEVGRSTKSVKEAKLSGFIGIAQFSPHLDRFITDELKPIRGEKTSDRYNYIEKNIQSADILKALREEQKEVEFFTKGLSYTIHMVSKVYKEPVEHFKYLESINLAKSILKGISHGRAIRLINVEKLQKSLMFTEEAINNIAEYRESLKGNGTVSTDANQGVFSKLHIKPQDLFNHIKKLPEVFLPCVYDVRYKRVVMSTALEQLFWFVEIARKEVDLLDPSSTLKENIVKDLYRTGENIIDAIRQTALISPYGFDSSLLRVAERTFYSAIKGYIKVSKMLEAILDNNIKNLSYLVKKAVRSPNYANTNGKLQFNRDKMDDPYLGVLLEQILSILKIELAVNNAKSKGMLSLEASMINRMLDRIVRPVDNYIVNISQNNRDLRKKAIFYSSVLRQERYNPLFKV
ncbi:uncharacterized protein NESG_01230 [Nematocida ausubeli]|uniref:Uncharacterized protein n=1 Tax=Nematocida ausubeli (strain ATCC PRA-371 / ERTm2) TaxID=1913371 RepID=A0A086J1U7_NEMA1|nr:uncharacterized protein NESG_01230 [Nematocida ausubeli]KFG26115.1 hypothetical protein NESG_01230 [Nematocida ausubeli]